MVASQKWPQCFHKKWLNAFGKRKKNMSNKGPSAEKTQNMFSQTTNLHSSIYEFPNDKFKFDETGKKFSKQVENTVGNREIVHYEQFLLFPQSFQKTCTADT